MVFVQSSNIHNRFFDDKGFNLNYDDAYSSKYCFLFYIKVEVIKSIYLCLGILIEFYIKTHRSS